MSARTERGRASKPNKWALESARDAAAHAAGMIAPRPVDRAG
jgi:hypothetical protein